MTLDNRSGDKIFYNDHSPTEEAMKINRKKIKERMLINPKWKLKEVL
jgi:hypothetical protein